VQGKSKAGIQPGAGCWILAAWKRQQQECPPGTNGKPEGYSLGWLLNCRSLFL